MEGRTSAIGKRQSFHEERERIIESLPFRDQAPVQEFPYLQIDRSLFSFVAIVAHPQLPLKRVEVYGYDAFDSRDSRYCP